MTLRVERSENQGRDLYGLFVRAATKDGKSLAVTADTGTFLSTDDPDVILLRLQKGTLVHSSSATQLPRVLSFDQHDLPINLPAMESFRVRGDRNLELTLPELTRVELDPATPPLRKLQAAATLNRRIVQCVIMFLLPFLAVALAVPPKRSTSALGVFVSIVLLVTFHKLTEYGERMGAIGRVDPVLAQWVPFTLFAGLCLWLYYILAYKPGGQPIAFLDRWFAKLASLVGRLARRPEAMRTDIVSAG